MVGKGVVDHDFGSQEYIVKRCMSLDLLIYSYRPHPLIHFPH